METSALAPESLYDVRRVTDLSVSPDGDRVAFVLDEFDPADRRRQSLFVAPADGSREPHRLTRVSNAAAPTWSPGGDRLGFLASRERDVALCVGSAESDDGARDGEARADEERADGPDDRSGDEDTDADDEPTKQVWAFDLARGGDARQLTDFADGVSEFDWGPDGDRLVVAARDPTAEEREYLDAREEGGPVVTERLQHKFDGHGWLDTVATHLFVVDLDTRETTRLDGTAGNGAEYQGGLQPTWGPGEIIAFRSKPAENPDASTVVHLRLVEADGSEPRTVTDSTLAVSAPRFGPSGDRVAFVAGDAVNWYRPREVHVADLESGEYRSVSASLDRTAADWAGRPAWVDEGTLVAPVGDEGTTRLARLDAVRDDPERVFEAQGTYRSIAAFDLAGGTVGLCLTQADDGPDAYAMAVTELDAEGGAGAELDAESGAGAELDAEGVTGAESSDVDDPLTRLSRVNAAFVAETPTPGCERVRFEHSDGDEVEGFAYLPPDFDPADPEPRPLVAAIHGGPMVYDAPGFDFDDVYWTNRGYVVLRVNYRGSTSYGRAFSESIRGRWGPRERDDVVSGVFDLVERGWADADRLFVTGFSQGAINTAYVVTHTDAFAAAAAEHGIYDFRSLYGTGDMHAWYENDVGLPWEAPDAYRELSTIDEVDRIETPTLLMAGEEDWRCPPTQAEQLYVSLCKRGVPSKLVVYPGEHHAIEKPERAIHRLRTLTEWFEAHDPGA